MKQEHRINFLVVGAQKSGTSALDMYLREHSEIGMACKKEVHFFDRENNFVDGVNYDAYHKNFSSDTSKIKGECTPIYMYWSPSMSRIFEYNPDIKIIAVLRNPIERAFSHWNMERDRNADTATFSTAIREENIRCEEALPLQHRVYSYTDRGFYSKQIKRIWQFFPKEQTLFIKHDDLRNSPHEVLGRITDFLGVSGFNYVEEKNVHSRPYVSKLSKDDYDFLYEMYTNEFDEIEQLLNWDCSDWKNNKDYKTKGWKSLLQPIKNLLVQKFVK